ncbi:MAG: cadherin-like beta sandwich domain-containing protein [Clostridia bacterium]|nr:cadherin-like beta sandwich domain-containing protein [Clostridia bacterium]
MKKIVSLLLAFAMLFALVPLASAAGTATLSFTVSSSAPTVGNQISFKVNFTGANIGSYQYTLRYNPEVLEYIGFSGDGDCDGAGGAVTATGVFDNNVSSVSTTVTFKTKKVGSDTINLSNIVVVDGNDFQKMNISGSTSKTINVAAKPEASTDNTLKSLSVSPAGLTPAFATGTTQYTMQVDYATTKLVVSATPNHAKAKVIVHGGDNLLVGENTVNVVCTAESGASKTYTIKVTRKASDYAGVTADVGGIYYSVGYNVAEMPAPVGYTRGESTYGTRKIITFSAPANALKIAWLIDSSNVGAWFVYDEISQSFSKYQSVTSAAANFVLLNMPSDISVPEGFAAAPVQLEIGSAVCDAYAAPAADKADFYLIYAMDASGTKGLYIYDKSQGTVQRYFSAGAVQVITPVGDPDDDADEPAPQVEKRDPIVTYILLGAAGLLFVGGVIMLVVLLKKPEYKREDNDM